MGMMGRTKLYEAGEAVSALKNGNALNKYFDGEVTAVHDRPQVDETHWNAEKSIVLHLLAHTATCFLFYTPKRVYDIRYADGSVDTDVPPARIRKRAKEV